MKKRNIYNISIISLIIVYVLIYVVFLLTNSLRLISVFNISFLLVLCFIAYSLLGFRKNKKNYINEYLTRVVFIYCIVTLIIMYGMGFLIGFNKSSYSLNIISVLKYQLIPIGIIIFIELFRYIVIWANKDSKKTIALYIFFITIMDILMTIKLFSYNGIGELIVTLFITVLPIIVKNLMLSYLCYYSGYKTTMVYRIIMDGYLVLIPYIPNLLDIVNILILVNLPIVIYLKANKVIDQRENKIKPIFNTNKFIILKVTGGVVIVVLIGLISGLFPHHMIGIRSESMEPTINKGDSVIIEKLNKDINIKKGDIISYKDKNNIIVHRVIDIKNNKYFTKGDNNNVNDNKELKRKDIKGIVRVRIPYVAWPTIWISELFKLKK